MEVPPIVHVERTAPLPLSYAQQRLWFIDQLEPGGNSYNVHGAVAIDGPLDTQELKKSLQEIVRRHESLRTRFVPDEGGPRQVIDVEAGIDLPVIDLSSLPANERELEIKKLAHSTMLEPFDLTRGTLIRVKLLRLEAQRHVLLLVMHHIISDGWSIGLLEREVSALYGALAAGQPSPLPELPIQYADYSVWQKRYLSSEVLEKKLEYWKQQLAGLETLELPTDRLRPAVKTTNGAAITLSLPADLTGKLKDLRTAGNSHTVHGPSGRISGVAVQVHRTGRCCRGFAGGRAHAFRDGEPDWMLHQQSGFKRGPLQRPGVHAARAADQGTDAGSVCSPGRAF